MKQRRLTFGIVVLAAAALATASSLTVHLDFDSDQRGTTPAWLRFESTSGMAPGRWIIEPDAMPQSLPNVAVQGSDIGMAGQYRFAISIEAKKFSDGKIRVAVAQRKSSGFRAAGVVLRYRSPVDFLAAEYDFGAGEIEIFEVRGGLRKSLARAKATSLERGWTTLGLVADGNSLVASVSGRKVLEARDLHPESGEAGLITEGPTTAAFDELQIELP